MKTKERRVARVRNKLRRVNQSGLCRLSVFRSCQHIDAQIIDDAASCTVAAASTKQKTFKALKQSSRNKTAAAWVGESVAEKAKQAGIEALVFDRGACRYHAGGCLDTLVSSVRKAGIKV